jgi:peptidoglycan/xylan/chitin deacetylase (PgdA/CDA1 family)
MNWKVVFPEGAAKALTFSYDDGRDHDRKLVEILNRHGLKGSFHLNSGALGLPGHASAGEVKDLYAGHEISCHGVKHLWLTHSPEDAIIRELWEDRRTLEGLAKHPVRGMSYAFGDYPAWLPEKLPFLGIEYARTVRSTFGFDCPKSFLEWNPTCHHNAPNLMELAERFLNIPPYRVSSIFYVWGHSYEFADQGNWNVIEDFCAAFDGAQGIWRATNIEICRYVNAARNLATSVDGSMIQNRSGVKLWIKKANEELAALEAGGELSL